MQTPERFSIGDAGTSYRQDVSSQPEVKVDFKYANMPLSFLKCVEKGKIEEALRLLPTQAEAEIKKRFDGVQLLPADDIKINKIRKEAKNGEKTLESILTSWDDSSQKDSALQCTLLGALAGTKGAIRALNALGDCSNDGDLESLDDMSSINEYVNQRNSRQRSAEQEMNAEGYQFAGRRPEYGYPQLYHLEIWQQTPQELQSGNTNPLDSQMLKRFIDVQVQKHLDSYTIDLLDEIIADEYSEIKKILESAPELVKKDQAVHKEAVKDGKRHKNFIEILEKAKEYIRGKDDSLKRKIHISWKENAAIALHTYRYEKDEIDNDGKITKIDRLYVTNSERDLAGVFGIDEEVLQRDFKPSRNQNLVYTLPDGGHLSRGAELITSSDTHYRAKEIRFYAFHNPQLTRKNAKDDMKVAIWFDGESKEFFFADNEAEAGRMFKDSMYFFSNIRSDGKKGKLGPNRSKFIQLVPSRKSDTNVGVQSDKMVLRSGTILDNAE